MIYCMVYGIAERKLYSLRYVEKKLYDLQYGGKRAV